MNRRLLSVFAFALVVSGVASLLVYNFVLARVASANTAHLPKHHVLVAARNLEVGALITPADLRTIDTVDPVPAECINDKAQLVGRGVIEAIYQNEPIRGSRLAAQGAGAGLAAMIPVGKRAVALRVNDVVGVAGFVVPGMRVDVIVAGNGASDSGTGTISRTVLQNIEVLSAGHKIEKTADGKPQEAQVVNLLVTPAQAETLSLASSETKVQLVLRNPLDTKEEKTPGTSVAALLGHPVGSVAAPAREPVVVTPRPLPVTPSTPEETVEVFSGSKRTEQRLDH